MTAVAAELHASRVTVVCGACFDRQTITGPSCLITARGWADAHRDPRILSATVTTADGSVLGTWRP